MAELIDSVKDYILSNLDIFKGLATGIAYTFDKVFIFTAKNGNLICPQGCEISNNIHELRLFDKENEIFCFRENSKLKCRIITDVNSTNHIKSTYILWGTRKDPHTLKDENRGFVIKFPKNITIKDKQVKLVVNNLYKFNEDGSFYIYDAVFTNLEGVEYE